MKVVMELEDVIIVSFSGGKTSGFMIAKLKEKFPNKTIIVLFANTGLECEETLDFVNKVDKYFDLNVVWLEAVVNPQHGKGITHKVVSYETASRNGEPFEALIAKEGIPNMASPHCTSRLKTRVIDHYIKVNNLKENPIAIGIRADESRRAKSSSKQNKIYPLCDWGYDKQDVNDFWEDMPFNLELEEHQGNCTTCWKKSDKKLWLIAVEEPEKFDFMKKMESRYKDVNEKRIRFFRRNRSAEDVLNESKDMSASHLRKIIGYAPDEDSGCSESCEPY